MGVVRRAGRVEHDDGGQGADGEGLGQVECAGGHGRRVGVADAGAERVDGLPWFGGVEVEQEVGFAAGLGPGLGQAAPPAWQEPQPTAKKITAAGLPSSSRRLVLSIVDTVRVPGSAAEVCVAPDVVVCEVAAPQPARARAVVRAAVPATARARTLIACSPPS